MIVKEEMKKENYVLRRLAPAQWQDYKKIRLEALHTDPGVFGSNYQREAAYSQQDWVALLENQNCAIFGLYDHEAIVGLTGVVVDRDDASNAILIASFVREPHRGKGLSRLYLSGTYCMGPPEGMCTDHRIASRGE
ncbi:GNAT family N-acetyltransferase [Sphingobacterium detergens]|uniref:GNAT family N-acetyltransferase n=1 Tax=Sphingobacterium detergens TaxID=1145106 RepID=UPI003AAFF181